jgi:hypothetical protein
MQDYGKYRFKFIVCDGRRHATYGFLHGREMHRLEVLHYEPGEDIITEGLYLHVDGIKAELALDILQEYNRFRQEEYTTGRSDMVRRYGDSILEDYPANDPTEQTISWSEKTADDGTISTTTWFQIDLNGVKTAMGQWRYNYRTNEVVT